MVMMSPTLGTVSPGPTSAHAGAILFSSGRLEPGARYWKIIWVRMCYLLENALVRMLASLEAPRKPLEANLVAVLCELGAQNEDTHPPCGLPCKSRVTEVSGYQKTLSISARVARTTMPLSDTASSVPTSL